MNNIPELSKIIEQKTKHYLITKIGRTLDEATDEEFYYAFSLAIQEEIMVNWSATSHTFTKKGPRKLYYLSMEYMPGRLLSNNLSNLHSTDVLKAALSNMNRDIHTVFNMEPDIGIGNGGLGRLASCLLDSLATKKYPALGYGMRYQYGIFEQEFWFGVQLERPDCWLLRENPWEFRRDNHAATVKFGGELQGKQNGNGEEVFEVVNSEEVRALPFDYPIIGYSPTKDFSVLTLRLWSTKESPRNFKLQKFNAGELDQASENTLLTDVLYPNDNHEVGKQIRLKQEFLLVSASLQDIVSQHLRTFSNLDQFADKVRIQINDTHPALVIPELIKILTKEHHISFEKAFEMTKCVCSYTNHTVLKEALEEWNQERVETLLPRQYKIIHQINNKLMQEVTNTHPSNPNKHEEMTITSGDQIKMAHLCLYGAHAVNGVSYLHTEILKNDMFKNFYEMWPEKFINITNGVTQRRWLLQANPELSKFITDRIGDGWIINFEEIKKLKEFASDQKSQEEFLNIKKGKKQALLQLLMEQRKQHVGDLGEKDFFLDESALFSIQAKRIHEYKRQLMNILHTLMVYLELKEDFNSRKIKRITIIAGKAAPGYYLAKSILRLAYCLSRKISEDKKIRSKLQIHLIENYNVSKAEIMVPAADLSEQISTAGMEASGTGNMKFTMNGALTIGTDDGANVEMRQSIGDEAWPFLFGNSASENQKLKDSGSYNPNEIINQNPHIAKALKALIDGTLSENEAEANELADIYGSLTTSDFFLVINDLPDYYEMQKKVESHFEDPQLWAKLAIENIAGMGPFSTDVSIDNYAKKIWNIEPCPLDQAELDRVKKDYMEHCRSIS